jgi:DNA modification methylase
MENKVNELSGKEWLQNSFSIWRGLSKIQEEKTFSHPDSFPISLCEKVIKTFSATSGKVINTFNGIGSTTKSCEILNREAVGIDLSEVFCKIDRKRISKKNIKIIANDNIVELAKQPENYFDLCFTSPPFWDILNMSRSVDNKKNIKSYSDKTDDIGNINDYSIFLNKLQEVFSQVHRVLKKNAYCVVNVMDIRKKAFFILCIAI